MRFPEYIKLLVENKQNFEFSENQLKNLKSKKFYTYEKDATIHAGEYELRLHPMDNYITLQITGINKFIFKAIVGYKIVEDIEKLQNLIVSFKNFAGTVHTAENSFLEYLKSIHK